MCPRTELELRRPDDFFSLDCQECGNPVEFFADDVIQNCADCGSVQPNPRWTDEPKQQLRR